MEKTDMKPNPVDVVLTRLGMNQTALADRLGVQRMTVSQWKASGVIPISWMPALCRLTGFYPHEIAPDEWPTLDEINRARAYFEGLGQ